MHAPTGEKMGETKDAFYEELEELVEKLLKTRYKIVIRDANPKVRREHMQKVIRSGLIQEQQRQQFKTDNI